MSESFADRKFAEAVQHVTAIISSLDAISDTRWVGYFKRLEACLTAGDVEGAVRARDAIPIGGMGGFADFLESAPQIQIAHRGLSEAVGALKVHSRYGIGGRK